jgi:hypothetical protein
MLIVDVYTEARIWLYQLGFISRSEAFRMFPRDVRNMMDARYGGGWAEFRREHFLNIGPRVEERQSVGSDGYVIQRWGRTINGTFYSFVRVEDSNRNAYIDVVHEVMDEQGVLQNVTRTFRGKATGPKPGIVSFSEQLGKLLSF